MMRTRFGSSGFCVEGRRIGIIWVHLNFVEISRGHFGRTQFDQLTDHGAPLPLGEGKSQIGDAADNFREI